MNFKLASFALICCVICGSCMTSKVEGIWIVDQVTVGEDIMTPVNIAEDIRIEYRRIDYFPE